MKKGLLITFEGGEGCGKTTHSNEFCKYLQSKGYKVLHTREPGGTALSEAIRELVKNPTYIDKTPEAELLLFEASRAEICEKVIRPAIDAGQIVVLDRFYDSTIAYQGYGRGLNVNVIKMLNTFATKNLVPDLTIYLQIEPEDAFKRKGGAEKNDAMELQSLQFHHRVKAGFDELAKEEPNRFFVINSNVEKEKVRTEIRNIFEERYGKNASI